MSTRQTSTEIASMAGRILAAGSPLDNDQVFLALLEAFAEANTGAQAKAALKTMFGPYFDNMLSLAGSCLAQHEDDPDDGAPRISVIAKMDWDKIVNAVIGSLEGGSTYWLREYNYHNKPGGVSGQPLYAETDFWAKGGQVEFAYDNPEDTDKLAKKIVGLDEIRLGLRSMATADPRHFNDMLTESDDVITHDVFMQHVILGEVVYD